MRPAVLYVHGAFVRDGAWWWSRVAEPLAARGITSHAVDLPSCGAAAPLGGFADDVATVRSAIAAIDGPVVVVAHSYGGMAVTEAAAGMPNVAHLLYVSAIVPDLQSVLTSGWVPADGAVATTVDFREDGTIGENARHFVDRLLSASDEDTKQAAMTRLTRQNGAVYAQETTAAAWREIESTYVVCRADGDVTVEIQRTQAARTKAVIELDTNHFPHVERPDLIADIVVDLVDRVPTA